MALLRQESYQPIKPKALGRKLGVKFDQAPEYREVLREMVRRGQIEFGKARVVQLPSQRGEIIGTFQAIRKGGGFVKPKPGQGKQLPDIYIPPTSNLDASTGDVVLVTILRKARGTDRGPMGRIVEIVERASHEFVGTYVIKGDEAFVQVDGTVFHEPIYVGDPGVKGAKAGDKVVFEMLRFPSADMFGEGVISEILGQRGDPDADLKAIIRQFKIPDVFSEQALAEARQEAKRFDEAEPDPTRRDLAELLIITIDPADARDFDDAVNLQRDEKGHWHLGVHIADVAEFVKPGTSLDGEARARATSVYLPGKVIPMLPELLSNGLASLQEDRPRYTKSVFVEFDPDGRITAVDFANSMIRVNKRLHYEHVQEFFDDPTARPHNMSEEVASALTRMRQLAQILRERRRRRGFIELAMPEARVILDTDGHVSGAKYSLQDESHRVIEEFMLTANEAVAQKLEDEDLSFLRRVHEHPDPIKLHSFAEFVRSLGMEIEDENSRFELQRIAREVEGKPEQTAVHYALLRSMKEAVYSPEDNGHFALASNCYCHFTSPIRRYPDLTIHRMLDSLIRRGKAGYEYSDLLVLGEHCSFAERRAAKAERELTKVKILEFLKDKVGQKLEMTITGVEEFGFFAQAKTLPAEGLIHIRTMSDDYYVHDAVTHTLTGSRTGKQFRLGMSVRCVIAKVDLDHRQLDLRLTEDQPASPAPVASRRKRSAPEKKHAPNRSRVKRPPPKSAQKKKGRRRK